MSKIPKTVDEGVANAWSDYEKSFVDVIIYNKNSELGQEQYSTQRLPKEVADDYARHASGIDYTLYITKPDGENKIFIGANPENGLHSQIVEDLGIYSNEVYQQFYTASVPKVTEQLANIYKQFGDMQVDYNKGVNSYTSNLSTLTSSKDTRVADANRLIQDQADRSQVMEDVLANIQF
jgi:hypothetical protein